MFSLHLMGIGRASLILFCPRTRHHQTVLLKFSLLFLPVVCVCVGGGGRDKESYCYQIQRPEPQRASDSTRPVHVSLPRPVAFEYSGADAVRGE